MWGSRVQNEDSVRGRKKLWEVRGDYLCSVIGTCLTLGELRRIARKGDLCGDEVSDYDLHGLMVGLCKERSETSRAVHKLLERKHAGAVRRARAAKTTEALREHWKQALEIGLAAGAYWAVVTHPLITPTLFVEAFGDIHMLSHLQGASRRTDLRQLEQARASAEGERERADALKELLRQERAALAASRERVSALEVSEARWREQAETERARYAGTSLAQELDRLCGEVELLRSQLLEQQALSEAAERRSRRLELALHDAEGRASGLCEERRALISEAAAAEAQIDLLLSELQVDGDCRGCPSRLDLGGACVLYVGGRQGLVRHYRELVERRGGCFAYHDGGLDDQRARLDALVQSADVVLCPIDAVSHDACLRAKRACKRGARPFVPLRTSGVTSLAAALQELPGAGATSGS